MNLMVVGGGAREHALVWKVQQSPLVGEVFVAPGNAGTAGIAHNLPIAAADLEALAQAAGKHHIDLTVVGPEVPLAAGIVDLFEGRGLPVFGPSRAAARIESSKVFAKELMRRHGIPQAGGAVFTSFAEARRHLEDQVFPLVVKADGLAAGKGAVVAVSLDEAVAALSEMMQKRALGAAGDRVIIEDYLEGREVSLLAFSDGHSVSPMVPACDYKRVYDGDRGPNTGGMGSYSPPSFFTQELIEEARQTVLEPTVRAMAQEGCPFKGVLYAGLMVSDTGMKVLEFNCRFGDPETQVILPRLKTDLVRIMQAVVAGALDKLEIEWLEEACVGVALASGGYPGSYKTGFPIRGLERVGEGLHIFHAGTKMSQEGVPCSDGGRVLTVVGCGRTLAEARRKAYSNIDGIYFENCHYRRDVGAAAG